MTGCEEINTKEISRILMTDYKGSRVWACAGAMKTKFHTKSVLTLTVISNLLTILGPVTEKCYGKALAMRC